MSLTRVTPLRPPGHGPGAARTYIHERVFSVSSSQPLWTSLGRRQDLDRLRPFGQIHVLSSRLRDGRWCATVVLSSQHHAGRRRNCCVHKRSQTGIGEGSTAACPTHTAVDDKSYIPACPYSCALRPNRREGIGVSTAQKYIAGTEPPACDSCGGAAVWQLVRTSDNWDHYRTFCAAPCTKSLHQDPRETTQPPSMKLPRGQRP